jgi:hypothetical protein
MVLTVTGRTQFHARAHRAGPVFPALLAAFFLTLLTVLLPPHSPAETSRPDRNQLKAAYLVTFARLVEWPPATPKERLTLCVLGNDPFGSFLEQSAAGKTVQGRHLVIHRSNQLQDLADCQILFVSPSEKNQLPSILRILRESRILTVGETDVFTHLGGGINFFTDENNLRFEINKTATDRAGLRLSSKLWKLAKVVREAPLQ